MLPDRRKSKSFATLGQGIEHEIGGIWWSFATFKEVSVKITLDPKQLETIKAMLDKVVNVAEKIATEMKRANDLKEKEKANKQ